MAKILITGGAGDIAQAIVRARSKHTVYAPDVDELDVCCEGQIKEYIEKYKPHIVVNCAGYIQTGTVKDSDTDEWIRQVDINLIGTYLVTHYALKNGAQTIINIASTSGMGGRPDWSAYCASKAGVISLTQSLAEEGVDAYCISPHRTATKMRRELFPDEDEDTLMAPEEIAEVVKDILAKVYTSGVNIEVGKDGITLHN